MSNIADVLMKIDPELPKLGQGLIDRVTSKQITMAEFDRECAYWLMGYVEDLRWRPLPTEPQDIKNYYEKKTKDPKYTLPLSFWQQPHIASWAKQNNEVLAKNNSNRFWLGFLQKNIPQEDVVNQHKIIDVLASFREVAPHNQGR